ncbi:MAG: hypothetical protein JO020_34365 [Chloroflexi bacterium]|nr:hypothetical protein [Chloroflexota bacterium]
MVEPDESDHAWLESWTEAQTIVTSWEAQIGRVLATREAAELTQAVARALWAAYQRGIAQREE